MHSARPLSVTRPLSLSPIITRMTDRQAFPFDGAGDFLGEPQSCSDDPPPRMCVCVSNDICVWVPPGGLILSEGCKMMVLIQLNNEDDVADDDDDYLGSKVCQRCVIQRDQWGSHSAKAKPEGPK